MYIEGVGRGKEVCTEDISIVGAIPLDDGTTAMKVRYSAPIIPDSTIPALLGMESLRNMRAVIDCATLKVYFPGRGEQHIEMPPGTRTVQGEMSPSGHLLLPFDDYAKLRSRHPDPDTATVLQTSSVAGLHESQEATPDPPSSPTIEATQ